MNAKRIFFITLISMFQLSALLSAADAEETTWQSISSTAMHYTVQYPQHEWGAKMAYHQEDVPEYVIVERAVFWNTVGAEIAVDVWRDDSRGDIGQWIDNHPSIFMFSSQELEKTTASVENLEALRYVVTSDDECEAYPSQEVYFKYGNQVFRLSYLEIDQGLSNDIYQYMIDTFDFTIPAQTIPRLSGTPAQPLVPEVGGHNDCGGQRHCSSCCGAVNSLAICCSRLSYHSGNCVWWAWQQACRVWGDAVPHAGNGKTWARAMRAHGYHVSSTPASNTIACWDRGTTYGHVAWVKEVRGNRVLVSEMACSSWYGVRDHEYPISYFDEGFIYPKGQLPNACGGRDVVLSSYPGSDCPATHSLTLKPGFQATGGKTFRGYIR